MIPPSAKKVFSGVVFDVYHWPQKMFDGTVATFEALRRRDACNVVVVTDDTRILYLRQRQPHRMELFGCLPGGGIEEWESPLEGAKRELLEETGFAASEWEVWKVFRPSARIDWMVHTFIVRGARKVSDTH